jgi:hypothetical protein
MKFAKVLYFERQKNRQNIIKKAGYIKIKGQHM